MSPPKEKLGNTVLALLVKKTRHQFLVYVIF